MTFFGASPITPQAGQPRPLNVSVTSQQNSIRIGETTELTIIVSCDDRLPGNQGRFVSDAEVELTIRLVEDPLGLPNTIGDGDFVARGTTDSHGILRVMWTAPSKIGAVHFNSGFHGNIWLDVQVTKAGYYTATGRGNVTLKGAGVR